MCVVWGLGGRGHLFHLGAGVETYIIFIKPVQYKISVAQFLPKLLCCAGNLNLKGCWFSNHVAEDNTTCCRFGALECEEAVFCML